MPREFPTYYTETFSKFIENNPTFLDELQLDTPEHTAKFKSALIARWRRYEIGLETEASFKVSLKDWFDNVKDYYVERINAYETQINWQDGIVLERDSSQTEFGMPNRSVSSPDGYQTGKVANHSSVKGNVNIVAQRSKYMASLRNVWLEFADSFEPLFITLFS